MVKEKTSFCNLVYCIGVYIKHCISKNIKIWDKNYNQTKTQRKNGIAELTHMCFRF